MVKDIQLVFVLNSTSEFIVTKYEYRVQCSNNIDIHLPFRQKKINKVFVSLSTNILVHSMFK